MKDKEWREHASAVLTALVNKPSVAAYVRALLLTTDKDDLAISSLIKKKAYGSPSATRIREYRIELLGQPKPPAPVAKKANPPVAKRGRLAKSQSAEVVSLSA